ncbi:Ribonuclease P protein component [Candidatus Arsenophonus lipoptenae]|uniref:Ribonuclease P protein component n=2 Tax=Morganellaceae TaxID=1903414 RepID=A0A0X9W6N3_9GAMM|nr:Ribonuclease P protein component [Candidatus Arsenophonus lipoptenae]
MFVFSRNLRLLKSSHFDYVFQEPKLVSSSTIIIVGRLNEKGHPRIGFAIAKKNVKLAHERNRIKRLIKEYFRLHQNKFLSMDFVILVKKGIVDLDNQEIIKILGKLWLQYYRLERGY